MKKNCLKCGKEMEIWNCLRDRKKFCSVFCARSYQMTGDKNYFHKNPMKNETHGRWNGGTRIYRRLIFEITDSPSCQICGRTQDDMKLVAHHKDGDRHNNELDNLQILCWGCHNRIHGNYDRIEEVKKCENSNVVQ